MAISGKLLHQQIIRHLAAHPFQKAREIARELNCSRSDVSVALYGELKAQVRRDSNFRWSLASDVPRLRIVDEFQRLHGKTKKSNPSSNKRVSETMDEAAQQVPQNSEPRLDEDLVKLLKQKIENLRPKLLDLTRRNPLINTPLSGRGNAYLRIVDELPDALSFNLERQSEFKLVPLPPLDEDPADEKTPEFHTALSEARITDDLYAEALAAIEPTDEDAIDQQRKAERELRDRLREILGMRPRQTKESLSLTQHAKNHHIAPDYELPLPSEEHEDGRHSDDEIQTLMLPDILQRAAGRLQQKTNTWMQETGLNVLHAAFGFLEWAPPNETQKNFSPLIVLPLSMVRRKTANGIEYTVKGNGEPGDGNFVLAEKLRNDHGIELPEFPGGSVEEYLETIAELAPKNMHWRVRRYATIGVFPSARIAMFHDLDTTKPDFKINPLAAGLLGGLPRDANASPFAKEYDVDAPEIEDSVPGIVTDADSSQFSVLVDIAKGKNLAVEGPPGTGKSQTIINAIAAALADGKKVLFVAEKVAALEVVRSRLEALGFGDFLLPLQADRSSRSEVIESLRKRLETGSISNGGDLAEQKKFYRMTRSEIGSYVRILSSEFANTGFTVFDVLSENIAASEIVAALPNEAFEARVPGLEQLDRAKLQNIDEKAERVERAWKKLEPLDSAWLGCRSEFANLFESQSLLKLVAQAADVHDRSVHVRNELEKFGIAAHVSSVIVGAIQEAVETLSELEPRLELQGIEKLARREVIPVLHQLFDRLLAFKGEAAELEKLIAVTPTRDVANRVDRLAEISNKEDLAILSRDILVGKESVAKSELGAIEQIAESIKSFVNQEPELACYSLPQLSQGHKLAKDAGAKILALRTDVMQDDSAIGHVASALATSEQLREHRASLEPKFRTAELPAPEELVEAAATLAAGGFFARLGSKYRSAKALYIGLLEQKFQNFDRQTAADDLDKLSKLARGCRLIDSDPILAKVCGVYFKGVDTDFNSVASVLRYYSAVDNFFAGIENRKIRDYLKTQSAEAILDFPNSDCVRDIAPVSDLDQILSRARERVGQTSRSLTEFDELCAILRAPDTMEPTSLRNLAQRILTYCEEEESLARMPEFQLLEPNKTPREVQIETVRDRLSAAQAIINAEPFSDRLLEALSNEMVGDLRSVVGSVTKRDEEAFEARKLVAQKSGVPVEHFNQGSPVDQARLLRAASVDTAGLTAASEYAASLADFEQTGLGRLPELLLQKNKSEVSFSRQVRSVCFRLIAKAVYAKYGDKLSKYNGETLDDLRARLAARDIQQIKSARKSLRDNVLKRAKPPAGRNYGRVSDYTEMGLIYHEVKKQKRHVSVRDLANRSGRAMQQLKPCWMMSPLAVAQYVQKSKLEFDLCIIDEASQMPPENALGAILRAKQSMIVGDTNQLPPTSFFRKLIDDTDSDEDETVLDESVLEMATGAFRPGRRLRWHYRSRHSGLIRFSNRMIYDDDLIVFPSASEDRKGMGVHYRYVEGQYRNGANAIESQKMVEAILDFMRDSPDRSLGVVTLNQKQRDLIQEELQYAIDKDTSASAYIEHWLAENDGLESFFVKNLENVQGDERDVIFIGTVYGPEAVGGKVHQRFGPINGIAGKRRLNVLFSRAKEQIITFSSMRSADIVAEPSTNPGAYMLRRWLEYSATGVLDAGNVTNRSYDSEFERYVADQISSMGFEVTPQVGVAGYFIDLGVKHPEWPHGFMLGVECDGAAYHSSSSARDRDRLRQQVLEGLGWKFHRIWSTDWFQDHRREIEKLRSVLGNRLAELKLQEAAFVSPSFENEPPLDDDSPMTNNRASEEENLAFSNGDLFNRQDTVETPKKPSESEQEPELVGVQLGDVVRVEYLDGDKAQLQFTLSKEPNDPKNGIVNVNIPLGQSVLGAEDGEEIEVLVGSRIRLAKINLLKD